MLHTMSEIDAELLRCYDALQSVFSKKQCENNDNSDNSEKN